MMNTAASALSTRPSGHPAHTDPGVVRGAHCRAQPELQHARRSGCLSHAPINRFPVAAIIHAHGDAVDELLARFAVDLRDSGWEVRGLVHCSRGAGKEHAALMDVASGECYPLFQRLGSGSTACSLDPGSIAAASLSLREALGCGADLALANRFGALEAGGGGLADEMLALMSEYRPLLTVVNEAQLSAWRRFTGGYGSELIPARWALEEWFFMLKYGSRPAAADC